jgi:hypothetical protein
MTKAPEGVQEGENQQPVYILNPNGDLTQAPEAPITTPSTPNPTSSDLPPSGETPSIPDTTSPSVLIPNDTPTSTIQ